jgi:hypothetical protein
MRRLSVLYISSPAEMLKALHQVCHVLVYEHAL